MCDDLFTLTPMSSLPSKFLVGSDFFTLGNGSLQPRNQCMYWPEIFCLKAVVLSAHMYVLVFQDQNTLLKWNILSLLVYKQAVRQNISLCEGVLVLEGQYIHMSRKNNSFDTEYFWPIHTYREQWIWRPSVYWETMAGQIQFSSFSLLCEVMKIWK